MYLFKWYRNSVTPSLPEITNRILHTVALTFWLHCTNVIYNVLVLTTWLSSGRSALVVNFYTLFAYSFFQQHFRAWSQPCSCLHAYPYKAAQMYFGRISPKPVLGMTEIPQIVQTVIRMAICADLSAFFPLLQVSLSRSLKLSQFQP